MLYNFLKVAFRNLFKNKLYVVLNTLGMGTAIACAMTAYLLVAYNIEFDAAIDDHRTKNIVKVLLHRKDSNANPFQELVAPIVLGPAAMQDITGIKYFSRFCSDGGYLSQGDKGFHETIFFADAAFLTMFQPPLVKGSYKSFDDKNAIFITEKFAKKYFGDDDPIGKEMIVSINNQQRTASVGGVLQNMPFNSTFTEDALMRIENYLEIYRIEETDWKTAHTASTLFELNDITQANNISDQLHKYIALQNAANPHVQSERYQLLPFSHPLSPNDVRESDLHLRIPFIALSIFMSLGGIILLIACFNLTNTTLSISLKRLKEIGIRKVVGSSRWQIAFQLVAEIIITVSLAAAAGFAISLYLIPEFASMWELPYGFDDLNGINILIGLLIILFTCALVSGIYPALFGSKQSPALLFRAGKSPRGTNMFTRSLLVIQFALCIMVLIAGTVFTQNADYQRNISFGYDKEMLITALIQGAQEAELLSNAIRSYPKIESVSPATHHFAFINAPEKPAEIALEKFNATVYDVGRDYFTTVGLSLIHGRLFDESDAIDGKTIVVDENFVTRNRLDTPLETVVTVAGEPLTIIGVVSNHLTDLESHNTENYIYRLSKPEDYQILVIRAEASTLAGTKRYVHEQWKKIYPGKPLRLDLQEEIVYQEANSYNGNLRQIFFFMTVLGCILSVAGLYSMASLNISRRTKEIGVRKVLGASMLSILKLINLEFVVILLAAAILGGYMGYSLTHAMLSDLYAQYVDVGLSTVIASSVFILCIGLLATSITIWTAASANPVVTLKES